MDSVRRGWLECDPLGEVDMTPHPARVTMGFPVPMAVLARRGFPCACRKNVGSGGSDGRAKDLRDPPKGA